MNPTIYFDDQASFRTIEISDVEGLFAEEGMKQGMLPPELFPQEATIS